MVARLRRDGNYLSRNGRKLVGSLWLGDRQPGSILLRLLRKGGNEDLSTAILLFDQDKNWPLVCRSHPSRQNPREGWGTRPVSQQHTLQFLSTETRSR